jgi:hypothetical protein
MAIAKRELLLALINSLDRSEKRFFTNHYQRRGKEEDDKYYRLFQHLAGGRDLADPELRRDLGVTDTGKMANLQRHLYGLLLESLRRQHRRHDPVIQVQEDLDYAHLLYDRGLYLEALVLLKRAKQRAKALHLDLHHILILEFEKMIESRHITRSEEKRMTELTAESRQRQAILEMTTRLSNLQLTLQRYFIEKGHVRGLAEAQRFHQMFYHNFTGPSFGRSTFRERIGRYRALFWYHYCTTQLDEAAIHARAWMEEFVSEEKLRMRDVSLYLKGVDRCLMLAFFRENEPEHQEFHEKLLAFTNALPANRQSRNILRQNQLLHLRSRLNQLLLDDSGQMTSVERKNFPRRIKELRGVDRHKRQVLHYKLAALLAMDGDYSSALDQLSPVLDDRQPLRQDTMIYSRLLFLLCHFKLGNRELVGYGINNLARYIGRINYSSSYPRHILTLLRSLQRGVNADEALLALEQEAGSLTQDPCERRDLRYFPIKKLRSFIQSIADRETP